MATDTALERAEGLAERLLPDRTPKRRMLVIVNPYATTVSDRLRNLVVYALGSATRSRRSTPQERGHATQICREAATRATTWSWPSAATAPSTRRRTASWAPETPLTRLPGGSTNVSARTLGIPNDVVDATEHLLRMADDFEPRRVDLGASTTATSSSPPGTGLDAVVVERVDAHPYRKARFGAWYYSSAAVAIFTSRYLVNPPRVRITAEGRTRRASP